MHGMTRMSWIRRAGKIFEGEEEALILAILQARVSSTRLPGKVLKPLLGEPMLVRQIERIRRAKSIDQVVVATSLAPDDDAIESLCRSHELTCFRGSLEDVLDRFYQVACAYPADSVVRLTGDCPLIDPDLIDRVAELHEKGGFDYTSNSVERTYPDGLDVEVVRFDSLRQAWRDAKLQSEREHVTSYLYKHPELFKIGQLKQSVDQSAMRWTVDEPADYELVGRIFAALYPARPAFGMGDVLALLAEHPEWASLNAHFLVNEGYQKSLAQDAALQAAQHQER